MDAKPEVADRPGAFDPGTISGEIEFDHVDFWYEADKPVLTDFNLKVQAGETSRWSGRRAAARARS